MFSHGEVLNAAVERACTFCILKAQLAATKTGQNYYFSLPLRFPGFPQLYL